MRYAAYMKPLEKIPNGTIVDSTEFLIANWVEAALFEIGVLENLNRDDEDTLLHHDLIHAALTAFVYERLGDEGAQRVIDLTAAIYKDADLVFLDDVSAITGIAFKPNET